jgi:GT2 family glycosyltransferase
VTLSVIIGTVGQPALVNCCIDELRRRATMPLEVVVVNNGSTAQESALLANLQKVGKIDKLLHYLQPIGYAPAYNAGIQASSGEYVLLLNNDAWPTQVGWDARLVSVLESVPNAMLVAATVPGVNGLHQKANGPQAADCELLNVPRVAFVAVLLRRSTMDALGPLDEAFKIGAYEDDDYCERILQANGLIVVDPAVHFFHVSGVTMMPLYGESLPVNKQVFENKWKGKDFFNGATSID